MANAGSVLRRHVDDCHSSERDGSRAARSCELNVVFPGLLRLVALALGFGFVVALSECFEFLFHRRDPLFHLLHDEMLLIRRGVRAERIEAQRRCHADFYGPGASERRSASGLHEVREGHS
jgi:hypothetical protein